MSAKPQNIGKPIRRDPGRTQHTHTSGETNDRDNLNTVPTSHVLSISPKSFKVREMIYKALTGFIVFSQTLGKY